MMPLRPAESSEPPYVPVVGTVHIVSAAINHGGKVWTGNRHIEIIETIWKAEGCRANIPENEEGFLTSEGQFVNRFQAGSIAFTAGQSKKRYEYLISSGVRLPKTANVKAAEEIEHAGGNK